MNLRFLALLSALTLAACVETTAPVEEPPQDACNAARFQGLVGQSEAVLKEMMLPAGARVIRPNDAITADFRADRLNVELGATGRIEKVGCY